MLKENHTPRYLEVYQALKQQITSEKGPDRLPSTSQLVSKYKVSHCTISKVVDMLKTEELLEGRRGKGVFIKRHRFRNTVAKTGFKTVCLYSKQSMTFENPFYNRIVTAIRAFANESENLKLLVADSLDYLKRLADQINVLVFTNDVNYVELAKVMEVVPARKIVQFNTHLTDRLPSVLSDNYAGGKLAADYLIECGHRRLGMLACYLDVACDYNLFKKRAQGFREAATGRGDLVEYNLRVNTKQDAYLAAAEILESPKPPTAIFAFTDIIASGIIPYCYEHGIRIPEDLSLVGFDNYNFSEFLSPSLTTIYENHAMLTHALREAIQEILSGRQPVSSLTVPPKLIERESVRLLN